MVAANPNNSLSLLDVAKRTDPNGDIPRIAELLMQQNEILMDIPWLQGNLPTGTRNTIRTGMPTAYWKRPNGGNPASKSTTAQIDEAAGLLESWSVIDKQVADLNGNAQAYRLSEASAFLESMNQQLANQLIYGNSFTNPERFMGLAPRYGAINGAVNAQNILNGLGSGSDNTSVYLVGWGENTVYGIYPRGSRAGLERYDFGLTYWQTSTTFGSGQLHAYVERFAWYCGLAVKDWRYVVRAPNVDVSDLVNGSGTQNAQQLLKIMTRMIDRLPNKMNIKPVFYTNRTVQSILKIQGLDKSQNILSVQQALGQFGPYMEMTFQGIPIRTNDQILNTESAVS